MIDNFDNTVKVQGHFKIEAIKNGKVIDTFEQKNLIMNLARKTFAKYCGGVTASPINKLVLGNKGHIGSDTNAPKTSVDGFIASRTQLFSEETGTLGEDYTAIEFTPTGISGNTVTATDTYSTVQITSTDYITTFVYEIPENIGNGLGSITYTECAMYTGSDIFSMRTFKGRIKDNGVALRITWKIMF